MLMMISSRKSQCLLSFPLLFLFFTIAQSTCSDLFSGLARGFNITTNNCKKLPTLGAEFGWSYSHTKPNRTTRIEVLFGVRHSEGLRWIAWGVNPGDTPQMVGTRAIIGVLQANGSMPVRTYNITAYTKFGCQLLPSAIEPTVLRMDGQASSNSSGYTVLSAKMDLDDRLFDVARLNHVWQVGYAADPDTMEPRMHPSALQNFDSAETINMTSGESSTNVGHHSQHLRMVHGVLNIVGWGTLLPIGVIIARYFREYPFRYTKIWSRAHIACQITGYIIGTAGWGIGIGLGRSSRHYTFHTHRLLGIFIFTFTTLQMLALRLRPKTKDEYRKYWDMYHHFLGYALLAVIAINMFHGIGIFKPNHKWKWAYIGILGALGTVALALEIYTWIKFLRKRGCGGGGGGGEKDIKKTDNAQQTTTTTTPVSA